MSIVQSPVMGQMKKSFANVNTFVHKGQNVISAKAFNRKDANTEAQQAQRASFKLISDVAGQLGGFLEKGFPNRAEKHSAYNLFMQVNLPGAIDQSGEMPVLDYSLLQVAKGTLPNVEVVSAALTNNVLSVELDTCLESSKANPTDCVQLLLGTKTGGLYAMQKERGSEATLTLTLTARNATAENIAFVYLFVVSADGRKSSNSVFVALG